MFMQLFGKWTIKKEKKATPLELVATDGSAKLSIMTMPTNGDYHLWSKVNRSTLVGIKAYFNNMHEK